MSIVGVMIIGKCPFYVMLLVGSMKCILLKGNCGIGGLFTVAIPPRRDEQLRPLRGVPAAPPESLAFGRGRRHIASVNCNLYLFLEVRAPVRGVVVAVDYMVMVLALVRKGLSRGYEVSFGGLLPRERVRDFFV